MSGPVNDTERLTEMQRDFERWSLGRSFNSKGELKFTEEDGFLLLDSVSLSRADESVRTAPWNARIPAVF